MNPVKVAVVGASGYSGQELIRILMRHPGVALVCVTSRQLAGKTIAEVYPRFQHHRFAEVRFSVSDGDPLLAHGLKVIDLSADFRIKDPAVFQEFYGQAHPAPELLPRSVYGLPEVYREQIRTSELTASPGCYPTSILLPLIPLLRAKLVEPTGIAVASMSGVSGAGRKASVDRDSLARAMGKHQPTALFCHNDWLALTATLLLSERGIRVPEDVSVLGVDNSPTLVAINPRLTTLAYPVEALGHAVLDLLDGKTASLHGAQYPVMERETVRSL